MNSLLYNNKYYLRGNINNLPIQNHQFENKIAHYVTYFIRVLHILFSIALMITVVLTLIVFTMGIYHIFLTGNLAEGPIHALGSLLVLWTLSELLHSEVRPCWTKLPAWLAKFLGGEMAEAFLANQKVRPQRLVEQGFIFDFPELAAALTEIYGTRVKRVPQK